MLLDPKASAAMDGGNGSATDTLFEVKEEVCKVKKIIDENGSYLTFTGDALVSYFQQLRTKEKYLESIYVDNLRPVSPKKTSADSTTLEPKAIEPKAEAPPEGYSPTLAAAQNGTPAATENGSNVPCAPQPPQPAPEPAGPPGQFDENDSKAIYEHMAKYEASATESAKALKALASLAYKDPEKAGSERRVAKQVLRILAFHQSNGTVLLNGAKALGNIANDETLARTLLATKEIIHALIAAKCKSTSAEVQHRCLGAICAIVEADTKRSWQDMQHSGGKFPSRHLFTLPSGDGGVEALRESVVGLVKSLISAEKEAKESPDDCKLPAIFAQRFIDAAEDCETSSAGAEYWLRMASPFSKEEDFDSLKTKLVASDVMATVHRVMSAQVSHAATQIAGMGAYTDLIGTDVEQLRAFAKAKGLESIDVAMIAHPKDATLQKRGMRCLQGGVKWTAEIRELAGFTVLRAVELIRLAMENNADVQEVQVTALEAIHKYVNCKIFDAGEVEEALKSGEGLALVKRGLDLVSSPKPPDFSADLLRYLAKVSGA